MSVSKNPFSLYDFLGYFVPGAFMLFALLVGVASEESLIALISGVNMETISKLCNFEPKSISLMAFVIVSYVFGHLLSYISSITIEFFSNRLFQYPSKYLLGVPESLEYERATIFEKLFKAPTKPGSCLLFFAYVVCFPVTLSIVMFAKSKSIKGYLTRALDDGIICAINKKMLEYSCTISYPYEPKCSCCDSHRIIMHYVNVNIPNAMRKVDNYVALYGFLRSMSLVLSLVFIMVVISAIRTIDLRAQIDWSIIFILCVFFVAPSVAYLGYLKFYRRHTLENFMAFLVAPIDIDNDAKEMLKNKYEKEVRKNVTLGVSFLSCKK